MVVKSVDYPVKPNTPIQIAVTIGNAQVGGTALLFKRAGIPSVPIDVNPNGPTPIGAAGEDLRGTALVCTTTVKDRNPNTNNTSVSHLLTGGVADLSFTFASSVPADGGIEPYVITFFL